MLETDALISSTGNVRDANVAVVIVNYRTPELTKRCLASLRNERELIPRMKVVVVDGASGDRSAEEIGKTIGGHEYSSWVSLLPLSLNGGYGWANNQAILTLARSVSAPEFIHILNPDTEVQWGAVAKLIEELCVHPECAAAGSQLLEPEGAPSASAFRFPSIGREFARAAQSERLGALLGIEKSVVQSSTSCTVDWVTGASTIFRVTALRETGLFDDGFFLYFEEVELMHRLRRAGWKVRHVPSSQVVHLEGASTGVRNSASLPPYWYRSRLRYFALTSGRTAAVLANLAWLTGRAVAVRKALAGGMDPALGQVGDLARFGLWPHTADTRPSVSHWGDQPGKPPAWIERGL